MALILDQTPYSWMSVYNPIKYKLISSFGINLFTSPAKAITSISNSNGYAQIIFLLDHNLSKGNYIWLDTTTFYNGKFLVKKILSPTILIIDSAFTGSDTGNAYVYANNYNALIKVYGQGLIDGYKFLGSFRQKVFLNDESNQAEFTFSINDFLKTYSASQNLLTDDPIDYSLTKKNNTNSFMRYYIEYADEYDVPINGYPQRQTQPSSTTILAGTYCLNSAIGYNDQFGVDYKLNKFLILNSLSTNKSLLNNRPINYLFNVNENYYDYILHSGGNTFNQIIKYYDASNNLIIQDEIDYGLIQNGSNQIKIDFRMFDLYPESKRICISYKPLQNYITNGDFSLGSGDTFSAWTKITGSFNTITQSTNGGLFGTRAPLFNRGGIENLGLYQTFEDPLEISGVQFTLKFFAKKVGNNLCFLKVSDYNGSSENITFLFPTELTNDWQEFILNFTFDSSWNATICFLQQFLVPNAEFLIDNVRLYLTNQLNVTPQIEEKCFNISNECLQNKTKIIWLNKNGAYETHVFDGNYSQNKLIDKEGVVLADISNKYYSPNKEMYNIKISSRDEFSVSQTFEDRFIADWISNSILDSNSIFLVDENNLLIPIEIIKNNLEVKNTLSKFTTISFDFRFLFNNNNQHN